MVKARIYRPAKTAMQSGKAKSRQWILEYCPIATSFTDPIMGWNGSNDTLHQIRLTFRSLESALAFAKDKNIQAQVETAHIPLINPKNYADNFRSDRVG